MEKELRSLPKLISAPIVTTHTVRQHTLSLFSPIFVIIKIPMIFSPWFLFV